MKRAGYAQLIWTVASMLAVVLLGAWLTLGATGIDAAGTEGTETPKRVSSAVQRFVWEFRNCYGCAAPPVDINRDRVR